MALSLVTAPTVEPISLTEAKAHLRVDVGDEDALIESLIKSAREYVETFTHRALLTQTWDSKLDAFPCDVIELPFAPVTSVTSITYVDTNGTSQTWSSSLYSTDLPSGPYARRARIMPAYQQVFPQTRAQMNAVVARFVAGYGAAATAVPESIRHAVKLLVGHLYARREPVQVGNIVTPMPLTVDALLWPFKSF